jgi:succinoglycan biosynthesis transport protein ExoP
MGEISEALKRARAAESRGAARAPEAPGEPRERKPDPPALREAVLPPNPPVIIPEGDDVAWHARAVIVQPRSETAEQYRHFAIRLGRRMKERDATTLIVTSATRAEGKTTTSCNLALALASMAGGRRVALVELDLRRPSMADQLCVEVPIGFEAVLSGEATLAETRLPTQFSDLDLYPVKHHSRRALELLSSAELSAALRELVRRYDTVIVDSPPILPVPDVPLVLPLVDAAIVVARAGVSRSGAFAEALAALGEGKVIGTFLNAANPPRQKRYYGYESYQRDESEDD